jgi:integrase
MARPQLKPGTHGSISYAAREGRTEASTYIRDHSGERLRMKASGSTEAEARDALIAKITLHNAGIAGGKLTPGTTVAELGIVWLTSLRDKSAVTMESYTREVRKQITPALGELRIEDVTVDAVEAFLATRPAAAGRLTRVVLRAMFAAAIAAGAATSNPVQAGTAPAKAEAKRRMTRAEYQAMLGRLAAWQEEETAGSARSQDLHDQTQLLLSTGVEKAPEMLAAAWEDLDLVKSTWTVSGTVERSADRGLHVKRYEPSEVRTVPLPGSAVLMLRRRRSTLGLSRTGLVFTSRNGGPVDPANWRRTFAAAAGDEFGWVRPGSLLEAPPKV